MFVVGVEHVYRQTCAVKVMVISSDEVLQKITVVIEENVGRQGSGEEVRKCAFQEVLEE